MRRERIVRVGTSRYLVSSRSRLLHGRWMEVHLIQYASERDGIALRERCKNEKKVEMSSVSDKINSLLAPGGSLEFEHDLFDSTQSRWTTVECLWSYLTSWFAHLLNYQITAKLAKLDTDPDTSTLKVSNRRRYFVPKMTYRIIANAFPSRVKIVRFFGLFTTTSGNLSSSKIARAFSSDKMPPV
jgi:hypothetical protein